MLFTYNSLKFCFYQVKLNLRSRRSVIFQFKKYWGIQFNLQFWITNSFFWLVNILLWKIRYFIKKKNEEKEMKIIKAQILW